MKKILAVGLVIALLAVIAMSRTPGAVYAVDNTSVDNTSVENISGSSSGLAVDNTSAQNTSVVNISLVAPSNVDFGTFKLGWNIVTSATPGQISVTFGTAGSVSYTVTAETISGQPSLVRSQPSSQPLDNCLLIGNTSTSGPWFVASGGTGVVQGVPYSGALIYSGVLSGPAGGTATADLPLFWAQYITQDDATAGRAGDYSTEITFKADCKP